MTCSLETNLPGRLCRSGAVLGALAFLLAGCHGKGATGGCGAASSDCGGTPDGTWQVTSTCKFPVISRPAQNYDTTRGYFQPETGVPPPAMTSGPWCWDLQIDMDGTILNPTLPMPNPDVVLSGTVTFDSTDHSYLYVLRAASTTSFHVAHSCFGANGVDLTCADFANKLAMSSVGANPMYASSVTGQPSFKCQDAGDGCDCQFDYVEQDQNSVGDRGTWTQDGNVIHHYSITGQGVFFETSPTRRTVRDATFCQDGDSMVLTGANGQAIALKAGTRTLFLSRVLPDAGTDEGTGGAGGESGGGGAGGGGGGGGAGGAAGDDGGAGAGGAGVDAAAGSDGGDAASDGG